jgi:hypothetical protein
MPDGMDYGVRGGGRVYKNPMNDPNSPRYWNRSGQVAPNTVTDGRGFGGGQDKVNAPWSNGGVAGTYGGGAPQPFPSTPPSGLMGGQQPQQNQYAAYGQAQNGLGGQNTYQMDMERRRRMLMQQQQQAGGNPWVSSQVGGVPQMPGIQPYGGGVVQGPSYQPTGGIGQVSSRMAENPYQQNMTQPFPVQNPWQQKVPQTFNQASAYSPYTRSW